MNPIRTLITLLIIGLAGMGAWVWKTKEKQWEAEGAVVQLEQSKQAALLAKQTEFQLTMDAKDAEHQKDIAAIMEKHEKDLDALRQAERQRTAQAFAQFGDILEGNKKTLNYLDTLEGKVKSGKAFSEAEAQQLSIIATGLGYLQKQYQKPFREFGELESYFTKRANSNVETPDMRNAFWKRTFSREFREQEREFYRTEGERRGFQEASEKFSNAYAAAQKQMKSVNLDFEKQLLKLSDLVAQQKPAEDLSEFFKEARKALTAHEELLEFEPEPNKPLVEQPKP
jgi:hypothetical protein